MVTAGWNCALKIHGTSTAFTGEAMEDTSMGADATHKVFKISAATKNYWNPATTVHVYDGGVEKTEGTHWEVESYLHGRIRFLAYAPSGAVTVDGAYFPMLTVDRAHEASIAWEAAMLDSSVFGTQWKARIPSLIDVTFSASRWEMGEHDYDPAVGTSRKFSALLDGSTISYFEFLENGGSQSFRLACLLSADNHKSGINSVVESALSGKLSKVKVGADFSSSNYCRA